MKTNIKTTLLLLVLTSAVIYLAGCKKTNASIVGVWTEYGREHTVRTQGVQTYDTTYQVISSQARVYTFNANGTFTSQPPLFSTPCTYSYADGKVIILDSGGVGSSFLYVTTLTNNNLVLDEIDTESNSPLIVFYDGTDFSR